MSKGTKEIAENAVTKLLANYCCDDVPEQLDRQTVISFGAYMLLLGIEAGHHDLEQNRIHQRSGAWNNDSAGSDYYITPLTDR